MRNLQSFCFRCVSFLLVMWTLVSPAQAQKPEDRASDTFSFLTLTDTHLTEASDLAPFGEMLNAVKGGNFASLFAVVTGDLTEGGTPAEFAKAKSAINLLKEGGVGFYAVPGNHDVRWNPLGKETYTQEIGKPYSSFDVSGTHFLLLDTTVLLEHWGHFDRAMLDWMAKDLKKLKPETPILVFMHHWIGRENFLKRPIDNEYDLWQYSTERDLIPLLKGRNVLAIFTGHGHTDAVWKTNGVTTLMGKKFFDGSFHRVTVSPLYVTIERFTKNGAAYKAEVVAKIPTRGEKRSVLQAGFDDPNVSILERRRPSATLVPRAFEDTPDKETADYRIDDGDWLPLTKNMRDIWSSEFAARSVSVGVHAATIRLTTARKTALTEESIFEVERDATEPNHRWATNLEDGIQSSPALYGDLVVIGANDGRVYGLDRKNGKIRWRFVTKGAVTATPLIVGDTVYIGSSDRNFYALNAKDGKQSAKYTGTSPIWGTAAITGEVVCVGIGEEIVGLSAGKLTRLWGTKTGGFHQSRIATDGTSFYAGCWDNTLYALDVKTGSIRWQKPLGVNSKGVTSFYYSPAIASPVVDKTQVYAVSNDGDLHALDVTDGHELWKVRAPMGSDNLGYSSPVANFTSLYVAGLGDKGSVYCFDTTTHKLRWQSSIGQAIYDSSVRLSPDGKTLAIIGVRGRVTVLDAESGKVIWKYELGPGNVFSTPEYDGSTVYTATMARDVQAINVPVAVDTTLKPKK